MSTMSDSWIPFQPAIDEPSNILPSSNRSSSTIFAGRLTCCSLPTVSVKRRSTNFTSFSAIVFNMSSADISGKSPVIGRVDRAGLWFRRGERPGRASASRFACRKRGSGLRSAGPHAFIHRTPMIRHRWPPCATAAAHTRPRQAGHARPVAAIHRPDPSSARRRGLCRSLARLLAGGGSYRNNAPDWPNDSNRRISRRQFPPSRKTVVESPRPDAQAAGKAGNPGDAPGFGTSAGMADQPNSTRTSLTSGSFLTACSKRRRIGSGASSRPSATARGSSTSTSMRPPR